MISREKIEIGQRERKRMKE